METVTDHCLGRDRILCQYQRGDTGDSRRRTWISCAKIGGQPQDTAGFDSLEPVLHSGNWSYHLYVGRVRIKGVLEQTIADSGIAALEHHLYFATQIRRCDSRLYMCLGGVGHKQVVQLVLTYT